MTYRPTGGGFYLKISDSRKNVPTAIPQNHTT